MKQKDEFLISSNVASAVASLTSDVASAVASLASDVASAVASLASDVAVIFLALDVASALNSALALLTRTNATLDIT